MDYDQIAAVFERLESRFGWEPMKEAGLTIGEGVVFCLFMCVCGGGILH